MTALAAINIYWLCIKIIYHKSSILIMWNYETILWQDKSIIHVHLSLGGWFEEAPCPCLLVEAILLCTYGARPVNGLIT